MVLKDRYLTLNLRHSAKTINIVSAIPSTQASFGCTHLCKNTLTFGSFRFACENIFPNSDLHRQDTLVIDTYKQDSLAEESPSLTMDRPCPSPSVCVVIPTYNRPDRLHACLEALCLQTLPTSQFEVVVVDDGSRDSMLTVVEIFRDCLNVKLVRQENSGPAKARNHGVKESRADLIAFTDDDCRPRPDWLGSLLETESRYPGAMVGGTTINGLPDKAFSSASQFVLDLVYHHFNSDPLHSYFLTTNNMLCRRSAILEVGGFDVRFSKAAEDRDFCDRWRSSGRRIVWTKDATIDHFHSQSLTGFIGLHFRYGIGAYEYQAKRRRQGKTMEDDISFHRSLIGYLRTDLFRRFGILGGLRMLVLLMIWQVTNTLGFFYASIMGRSDGKSPTE